MRCAKESKDSMEKELDEAEKEAGGDDGDYSLSGGQRTANIHSGDPVSSRNFAANMRSSNSRSRS